MVSACQHRFPNTQPETVAMAMTKTTKTTVFLKPSTWLMTSMLGSDKDGPAKSNANAGPLPMPEADRPCMIGTSVSVAKYMKAPVKLARKLDNREFPPTAHCIHSLGIMPAREVSSWVDPNRKPAVTTPTASSGMICLAKPQDENSQSRFSSLFLSSNSTTDKQVMATSIGTSGVNFSLGIKLLDRMADEAVMIAPSNTHTTFSFNIQTNDPHSRTESTPTTYHL